MNKLAASVMAFWAGLQLPVVEPASVAKVMYAKGNITLTRQGKTLGKISLLQELLENDRLQLDPKAELVLDYKASFRERIGIKEKIKDEVALKIGSDGSGPSGVTERTALKTYRGQYKNLQDLSAGSSAGRSAGVIFRSKDLPDKPPAATPVWGCTILETRPEFSWTADAAATAYVFLLQNADGDELWSVRTSEARLPFPKDKEDLSLGVVYRWRVAAVLGPGKEASSCDGRFMVANGREQKLCREWLVLIPKADQADLLQAAALFQKIGAYHESQRIYEKLVKRAPEEPFFAAALADHYERGGRLEEAKRLYTSALQLGYRPPRRTADDPAK